MCKRTVDEARASQLAAFAKEALDGRPRILVVDERGSVAASLQDLGFAVIRLPETASTSPDAPLPDRLLALTSYRFDAAVVCDVTERDDMRGVLAAVGDVLEDRGRLIIDDLDVDELDEATVAWFLETNEAAAPGTGTALAQQHLGRWLARKKYGLSGARAVREALLRQFDIHQVRHVEGLYRYVAGAQGATEAAASRTLQLREAEIASVSTGQVRAVGLQIVAERREGPDCGVSVTDGVRCTLRPGHGGLHQWRSADRSRTFEWG